MGCLSPVVVRMICTSDGDRKLADGEAGAHGPSAPGSGGHHLRLGGSVAHRQSSARTRDRALYRHVRRRRRGSRGPRPTGTPAPLAIGRSSDQERSAEHRLGARAPAADVDEVVIVDAHSTDRTIDVARSHRPTSIVAATTVAARAPPSARAPGGLRLSWCMLDADCSMDPSRDRPLRRTVRAGPTSSRARASCPTAGPRT